MPSTSPGSGSVLLATHVFSVSLLLEEERIESWVDEETSGTLKAAVTKVGNRATPVTRSLSNILEQEA